MKISNKKILISALLVTALIVAGIYTRNYYRQHEMLKVEVNPFKINNGWGYNITVDKKIYIHQESIPALSGNQVFASKEDAEKTGNLVVKKMIAGKLPSLTLQEVMGLGINPISTSAQ